MCKDMKSVVYKAWMFVFVSVLCAVKWGPLLLADIIDTFP